MNQWVDFYRDVMGFALYQHFDDKDISTEYSALMSKVMANGNGYVKFPINEPAEGRRKSQIEEYLDFYDGPGVQHHRAGHQRHSYDRLARCSSRASSFLSRARIPTTRNCRSAHRQDRRAASKSSRNSASSSTATTKATCCRSSRAPSKTARRVFYEIIQRKGSRSFGKGNFKALFEAIEREQALRGNL